MNEDRPLPKSSSAKWQPRAFSSRMKYTTLPRLAMAAVSVISKHIAPGGELVGAEFAIRYSRKRSSLSEVPDRLTAMVNGLTPEALRCTSRSSAWRTTQRSIEGMML